MVWESLQGSNLEGDVSTWIIGCDGQGRVTHGDLVRPLMGADCKVTVYACVCGLKLFGYFIGGDNEL
jgi:hypothetical protein